MVFRNTVVPCCEMIHEPAERASIATAYKVLIDHYLNAFTDAEVGKTPLVMQAMG